MKKIVLMMSFIIILLTGCGNNTDEYEKIMEEYAFKYYELHMNKNATVFEVTVDALNAVSVEDGFDMTKLNKCEGDSSTKIYIDSDTKEVINFEHNLKCD